MYCNVNVPYWQILICRGQEIVLNASYYRSRWSRGIRYPDGKRRVAGSIPDREIYKPVYDKREIVT